MSIQLQGNAESTFANDVTIGENLEIRSTGRVTTNNYFAAYRTSGGGAIITGGLGDMDSFTTNFSILADGSASFAGDIKSLNGSAQVNLGFTGIAGGSTTTDTFVINASTGAAIFKGGVTQSNSFIELDTGGTIDVKERLQNTQAILYRLKAALIQPDADANQLRTRLLEALDILTSDGDES